MAEMYPHIKHLHWLLIIISLILYNFRFWARQRQPEKSVHLIWKILPHANDTLLLFSGMMMMTIAKWSPFGASSWLGIKLLFVVAYIVLGVLSMRSAARSAKAYAFYAASLATMIVIAWLAHCKMSTACHFFANWV